MHFNRRLITGRHFVPTVLRIAIFAAAVSLLAYVPYKYLTQLHALRGLYAFLFPLSSFVAIAGIGIAIDSRIVLKLPWLARAGIGSIATLWLVTGILCVPSLVETALTSPATGLFAMFHMAAQHVFLSLAVVATLLTPQAAKRWLGDNLIIAPERADDPELKLAARNR